MFVWCMHVCRGQMTYVSPQNFFLRHSLSLVWSSISRLSCLAGEPQGSVCLHCSVLGLQVHTTTASFFYMGSGNLTQVLIYPSPQA